MIDRRTARAVLTVALVPAFLHLAGCGASEPRGSGAAGDPSELDVGPWAALPWVVTAAAPSLVIGGDETVADAVFHQISSATRLASGRLAVANSGTGEVFVFDEPGRRIGTVGGTGGGPGEFVHPMVSVVPGPGDAIVVAGSSPLYPKIAHFSLDGELLREIIPPGPFPVQGAFFHWIASRSGDVFSLHGAGDARGESEGVFRLPLQAIRVSLVDSSVDTLGSYPGFETFTADVGPRPTLGGPPISGPRPLPPLFQATSRMAGGGEPLRIAVGDQAAAAVEVFNEKGRLLHTVRWDATGRMPSRRDLLLAREEYLGHWWLNGQPDAARRALNVMPARELTPVFRDLQVDRLGRLWVERYPLPTDTIGAWWVFATDGRPYAKAALPLDLQILEIGADHLIGRARDELEIERVEVWRLGVESEA